MPTAQPAHPGSIWDSVKDHDCWLVPHAETDSWESASLSRWTFSGGTLETTALARTNNHLQPVPSARPPWTGAESHKRWGIPVRTPTFGCKRNMEVTSRRKEEGPGLRNGQGRCPKNHWGKCYQLGNSASGWNWNSFIHTFQDFFLQQVLNIPGPGLEA